MTKVFTAYVKFDPETKLYVGTVPGLAGAHSQGSTLDELQKNLREVIELVIEEAESRAGPRVQASFGLALLDSRFRGNDKMGSLK